MLMATLAAPTFLFSRTQLEGRSSISSNSHILDKRSSKRLHCQLKQCLMNGILSGEIQASHSSYASLLKECYAQNGYNVEAIVLFCAMLEAGKYAAEKLLELEPEDAATYVLLSNILLVIELKKATYNMAFYIRSKLIQLLVAEHRHLNWLGAVLKCRDIDTGVTMCSFLTPAQAKPRLYSDERR
ncbi:hypothetical protein SUGI_0622870 [Cryptomeria japonica]|nr:hypothetical protein SUGI_0622870 [Cryptomeria japonica]